MRKLQATGVILGTLLLIGLGFMGCVEWGDAIAALPPETPGVLYPGQGPLRVGVLGDAQKGLANLSRISNKVLHEPVNFMIQTGDLVSRNDKGHYRLAMRYLSKGGVDRWPFVAPGNHDLKGGPELFHRYLGDLERSFTVAGVAFVILNNAFGNPVPDPRHVEARIAAAGPHEAVILAMHQPPFDLEGNPRPEYATLLNWLEKSKAAYLLCGHVHTYMKKKVGDTTVIINGVGGDSDAWQFDQTVYATIIDIEGRKITDRRIELPPVHEAWENVEHLAIGHVAEAYRQLPILCWGATLLLAGGVGWGWTKLWRRREPFRQAVG